jgi:hypothetical protein
LIPVVKIAQYRKQYYRMYRLADAPVKSLGAANSTLFCNAPGLVAPDPTAAKTETVVSDQNNPSTR